MQREASYAPYTNYVKIRETRYDIILTIVYLSTIAQLHSYKREFQTYFFLYQGAFPFAASCQIKKNYTTPSLSQKTRRYSMELNGNLWTPQSMDCVQYRSSSVQLDPDSL